MSRPSAQITVKLVVSGETLSYNVGLHTPLLILKNQLAQATQIQPNLQVLQLLDTRSAQERDWKDPEDRILCKKCDALTLRELEVVPGSVLSLHSLGPPSKTQPDAEHAPAPLSFIAPDMEVRELSTPRLPREADHSFAGVLWDCEAVGPYELTVQAIAVAGMLGRVRVFAKNGSWNDDKVQVERTHWGQHYDISPDGWELVADEHCAPSWDTPRQVALRVPVVVSPHRKVALFVHSNLPDDLGIQYQSYGRDSVVAQDDMLRMLPGLGFTGHVPFSRNHGWYRAFRGPCGRMKYAARLLRWSPAAHPRFPPELKEAVMAMLLCNARSGGEGGPLASLPKDVVLRILEHCHHDWFQGAGVAAAAPAGAGWLAGAAARLRAAAAGFGVAGGTHHSLVVGSSDEEEDDGDEEEEDEDEDEEVEEEDEDEDFIPQ